MGHVQGAGGVSDQFIQWMRRMVATLLSETCTPPVYSYLPDDVAHLPCLVVGRPSMRETGTPIVMRQTLDVTLLGRRISDEDSQAELDAYADELFDALGATRGVKVDTSMLTCRTFVPGTVLVASSEYPAYLATVTIDITSC